MAGELDHSLSLAITCAMPTGLAQPQSVKDSENILPGWTAGDGVDS